MVDVVKYDKDIKDAADGVTKYLKRFGGPSGDISHASESIELSEAYELDKGMSDGDVRKFFTTFMQNVKKHGIGNLNLSNQPSNTDTTNQDTSANNGRVEPTVSNTGNVVDPANQRHAMASMLKSYGYTAKDIVGLDELVDMNSSPKGLKNLTDRQKELMLSIAFTYLKTNNK